MIFKRLYNWIKFKTLPPSVLFKNRLYIERDSKTRRITSNLGLTFRNSKWTNYARTDINLNFKNQFINSLFVISFIVLIIFWVFNGTSLYNTTLVNNELLFFIWYLKDLCLYYLFSICTICTFLFTNIFEKVYTIFSGWVFTNHVQTSSSANSSHLQIPSNQYKYIYYNWLLNSNSQWDERHSKLFNTSNIKHNDPRYLMFLFQINNYLSRIELSLLNTSLNSKPSMFSTLGTNFNLLKQQQHFSKEIQSQTHHSLRVLESRFSWNLSKLLTLLNTSSKEKLNFNDSFYLTNLNFMQLNNSLIFDKYFTNLNESISNQLNTLKSHKFLYNYSFLHRKILKDSHKLTMVKR